MDTSISNLRAALKPVEDMRRTIVLAMVASPTGEAARAALEAGTALRFNG